VVKYPDSTKTSLEQRLHARARERWPDLDRCRLRYSGSAHRWGFAIYGVSHDDYEDSSS